MARVEVDLDGTLDVLERAALAQRGSQWRPIETYPPCGLEDCDNPNCDWGPETLLLMPTEHAHVVLVGHKEAGSWLARDAEQPSCWGGLENEPTHWAPIPPLPNATV